MPEVMVHVRHMRAARMCNREPRLWFKRHGLSWTEFVTTGIPESVLLATNDSLALPVIEIARREAKEKVFKELHADPGIIRPEDDWIDRGPVNVNR